MTIDAAILQKIEDVRSRISPEEFREVCSFLSSLPDADSFRTEQDTMSPYEIANSILALDKPRSFPECLINGITDLFELEIAEGNADAMNDLGACYYEGDRGFEQNFEKAVHYYKMAAEKGNRQAQENLGYCYYYGRVGDPDYEKAFHYFALRAFGTASRENMGV